MLSGTAYSRRLGDLRDRNWGRGRLMGISAQGARTDGERTARRARHGPARALNLTAHGPHVLVPRGTGPQTRAPTNVVASNSRSAGGAANAQAMSALASHYLMATRGGEQAIEIAHRIRVRELQPGPTASGHAGQKSDDSGRKEGQEEGRCTSPRVGGPQQQGRLQA